MNDIIIKTLQTQDAAALLQFEQENRSWFERHIAPRDAAFYTPQGVRRHIEQYLDGYANGAWHPCLLLDADGRIVGRANLKNIDRKTASAEVGYRIARDAAGRGLATRALLHLVALAQEQWRLQHLQAYVTDNNLASARVLNKCAFVRGAYQDGMDYIDGTPYGGHQFTRTLR